jgi:membrane-bound lytic murein transglycosylase D
MKSLSYVSAALITLGGCAHAPRPDSAPVAATRIERTTPTVIVPDSITRTVSAQAATSKKDRRDPSVVDYSSFDLAIHYNEEVEAYVTLYAERRRATFTTWLGRMGRYRAYIEQRLDSLAMPRELVYIPLIESAYRTNVGSAMGAAGLWQFMKGTARAEGLEVSAYIDERKDPFAATDAALQHLQRLYRQFDSWYLAFAAYNSGSGRILRLLKERGLAKSDDAYWQIRDALPKETRSYVPMLLGAVIVGENAPAFGLNPDQQAPVRYDLVNVPGGTRLTDIATASQTTLAAIQELNPQFLQDRTPPDRVVQVRVPLGAATSF